MLVYGIGEQQAFALLRSCFATHQRATTRTGRADPHRTTHRGRASPTAPIRVELNRILAGHAPADEATRDRAEPRRPVRGSADLSTWTHRRRDGVGEPIDSQHPLLIRFALLGISRRSGDHPVMAKKLIELVADETSQTPVDHARQWPPRSR
ncbi:hypothetical protein [Nocardia niwae]|uniref:hypothetical protein n=1 Tax=Nocardia niwae TaxID=626084 RepID=UPI0033FB9B7F